MIQLGCIADDFTGATDLANNLVRGGMRVVQCIGVPDASRDDPTLDADAVVIALKSRTIAPREAVAQSLAACDWLREKGARQIYFKVCSTFDSTPNGNIGPVAEALLAHLDGGIACVTPAFPATGRAVFKGHLFVGDVLLSESGMRHHPLTPMTDANLVRVLQAQCSRDGSVGLLDHATVRQGSDAVARRLDALRGNGVRFAVADAIADEDLLVLGRAVATAPLVVAASGLAIGLPQNHGLKPSGAASSLPAPEGLRAIVSGSCSTATLRQVGAFTEAGGAAYALDPMSLRTDAGREASTSQALAWARARLANGPVLIYSSASPQVLAQVQSQLGAAEAGAMVESALGDIARGLVESGVRQLVVAGGETSGAVVQALGVHQMRIGAQIDPGVPWCHAASRACGASLHLALKSGNFGADDFFAKAFAQLSSQG